MGSSFFSKNSGRDNRTHEQNRYDAISSEIKTRREYDYSMKLFRLWFHFVQDCASRMKSEAHVEATDKMVVSLYSLALYNSCRTSPRQNDTVNDTALEILRCYTWKKLINANKGNDSNENLTLAVVAEISKCYLRLKDYIGDLYDKGIDEKDVYTKKLYFVLKQFGEMNAMASIIIASEEVAFAHKYSVFMNSLPNQWKDYSQMENTIKEQGKSEMIALSESISTRQEYCKCETVYDDIIVAYIDFDSELQKASTTSTMEATKIFNKLQPEKLMALFFWFYVRTVHLSKRETTTILDLFKLRFWKETNDVARTNERIKDMCVEVSVIDIMIGDADNEIYRDIHKLAFQLSLHLFSECDNIEPLTNQGYSRSIELALTRLLNIDISSFCTYYEHGHPLIRSEQLKGIETALREQHGITNHELLNTYMKKAEKMLVHEYEEVIANSKSD